jgi:hypothetical protein
MTIARLHRSLRRSLVPAAFLAAAMLAAPEAMAQKIGDVFYIEMENHNLTQPSSQTSPQQIFGNPAAPYINSLMTPGNPNAAQSSWASNYLNVATGIHPSEPNYVWQEAGLTGPLNDNDPFPNNIVNAPNLSALLQQNGIGWKSYQEDMRFSSGTQANGVPTVSASGTLPTGQTNAYNGSNQYNFAPKHDGQLFFTATNGASSASHYAELSQLSTDLANNTVARYTLITPDQYNDAHSALPNGFTYKGVNYTGDAAAIAQGDNFLSIIVPQIMASQAYKNNGAIVIWWDETEGGDDPSRTLPEIVLSPLAKGNAYDSTLLYTHSSDLKTMQELFGVYGPNGSFLGDAGRAGVNDLSDLFLPNAVPEPSSMALLGLGAAAGLFTLARRRRRV